MGCGCKHGDMRGPAPPARVKFRVYNRNGREVGHYLALDVQHPSGRAIWLGGRGDFKPASTKEAREIEKAVAKGERFTTHFTIEYE